MAIKSCVILVGGKGTRLGNLTKKTPKPLLNINSRPFLDYIISKIAKSSIKEIYLICSYKSDKFIKYYRNNFFFGKKIKCIIENKPLDTGGALFSIKKQIKNDFLLMNGDSFIDFNIEKFVKDKKKNYNLKILLCKNKFYRSNTKLNQLDVKKNGNLVQYKSNYMNAGVYIVKKSLLNKIKNEKKSLEKEIIPELIVNKTVIGEKCNYNFIDIGTKQNVKKAKQFIKKNFFEKAVFLDRDGVINEDKGYVHKIKDFKILNGVISAIKFLNQRGFLVFVVSNQSGIGRGIYKKKQVDKLHAYFDKKLSNQNSKIEKYFYCPYHPIHGQGKYKKNSYDRKPNPGMLKKIIKMYNVDIKQSFMIGDKKSDYIAASRSGVKFFYKKNINFYEQIKGILNEKF